MTQRQTCNPGAVTRAQAVDLNVADQRPDPNTTAEPNARAAAARLHRETFRTSRLLEFCSVKGADRADRLRSDRLAALHLEGDDGQRDRRLFPPAVAAAGGQGFARPYL